jgi:hypothetical protein
LPQGLPASDRVIAAYDDGHALGSPDRTVAGALPGVARRGHTPLVPAPLFREELPEVEVLAKMECLNPGDSLKDRPVLRMVLSALDDGRLQLAQTILDSSSVSGRTSPSAN